MLIAGIAGCLGRMQISELISSIMAQKGYKVSITDSLMVSRLDGKKLGSYLDELVKSGVDILIIRIETPVSGIKLLQSVEFNVIIFTGVTDEVDIETNNEYRDFLSLIFKLLHKKGVIILNADGGQMDECLYPETNIIGYGFKSDSVVTTSSVGDTVFEGFLICCIQKAIKDLNGRIIEPQERKIEFSGGEVKVHNVLAAVAFDILCGTENDKISI